MGHRASVCYWNGSEGSVHYSHWGALDARLINQISEDTPFGSESMKSEYINEILASFEKMSGNTEISGHLTEASADTPVEPERNKVVESTEEWAQSINALMMECAYLVDMTKDQWEVSAYAPVYWRDVDDLGDSGYVLIDKGEDAHANWEEFEAETWQNFLNQIRKEHGEPDFIVQPE